MDSISIVDWVKMIINPKSFLALDDEATKEFQLFAAIMCDQVWISRNKAYVDGIKIAWLILLGKCINPLRNTGKLGRFIVKIPLRTKHGSHLHQVG